MLRFIFNIILCFLLLPFHLNAASTNEMEVGLRGGRENGKSNLVEDYAAGEIYFLKKLPWGLRLGDPATLSSRFDLGVTYLTGAGEKSVMVAAGGDLVLGFWQDHIELEIGFRPCWLFDHTYGEDNFGGGMQFTSHAGLAIRWQSLLLNYRLQHTSNAGLYENNPGLNLHMVGLGYRF